MLYRDIIICIPDIKEDIYLYMIRANPKFFLKDNFFSETIFKVNVVISEGQDKFCNS